MHPHKHAVAAGLFAAVLASAPATPAWAGEVLVAVAANFMEAAEALEPDFEAASGHELVLTAGSTGKLYAQIVKGAPFDVLLAADRDRPQRLVDEGHAVAESLITYVFGRLTLWSTDATRIPEEAPAMLEAGAFRALALANPDLAPYGMAAKETLRTLGLLDQLQDKLVMGQNVGQTYALVATGNAELGFVALSQVVSPQAQADGSRWDVPTSLHPPIMQDAVLLKRAAENEAAQAFMAYLVSDRARLIITRFGYGFD